MLERKVQVEKDNVKKFIEERLVSDYISAGWSKVDLLKENIEKLQEKNKVVENKKSFKKD